jgi:hypothetical protein
MMVGGVTLSLWLLEKSRQESSQSRIVDVCTARPLAERLQQKLASFELLPM